MTAEVQLIHIHLKQDTLHSLQKSIRRRRAQNRLLTLALSLCVILGLVPEQKVQRTANEAAECTGGPAACLLQRAKEDEAPGGQAGGSRHSGAWSLWLLWR